MEMNCSVVDREIDQLHTERMEIVERMMECDHFLSMNKIPSARRSNIVKQKNQYAVRVSQIKRRLRVLENERQPKNGAVEKAVLSAEEKEFDDVASARAREEHYKGVRVSDHAVIRWLERKHGVDITQIRKDMYADAMASAGSGLEKRGGMYFAKRGDMTYIVNGTTGIIVTCYQHDREVAEGLYAR